MNVECRYVWYGIPVPVPFSDRIVFYLCSRHPERHHPTLLVLAHLHHSLHRLFDRRGHRLGSLGTWDAERQQPTHPAEGWRAGWIVWRLKSFGVHLELLCFLLSFGMLTAGLTSAIGYWTSYQGQWIYCRCFRSVLSYLKQFHLTALHNAQYVGVQRSQQSAKVSFAKIHSANQTCVVQVLLFAAGLFFFGLGLLTARHLKQLVLKKWLIVNLDWK